MSKLELQNKLDNIRLQRKTKEDSLKKIKKAQLITIISTLSLMVAFCLLMFVSPLFVAGVLADVFLGTILARIMEGYKNMTDNEIKNLNIDARYIQRKIGELEKEETPFQKVNETKIEEKTNLVFESKTQENTKKEIEELAM